AGPRGRGVPRARAALEVPPRPQCPEVRDGPATGGGLTHDGAAGVRLHGRAGGAPPDAPVRERRHVSALRLDPRGLPPPGRRKPPPSTAAPAGPVMQRGLLVSFDAGTYTAVVHFAGSLSGTVADVPVSRAIASGEMTAGRTVAVAIFDS